MLGPLLLLTITSDGAAASAEQAISNPKMPTSTTEDDPYIWLEDVESEASLTF